MLHATRPRQYVHSRYGKYRLWSDTNDEENCDLRRNKYLAEYCVVHRI